MKKYAVVVTVIAVIILIGQFVVVSGGTKCGPGSKPSQTLWQMIFKSIEPKTNCTKLIIRDTTNWKTYTNTQYGFEFKYPVDEIMLDTLSVAQNNIDQKTISLKIKNTQDVSGTNCIQGEDIKCDNIFVNGHNIVVQYGMQGGVFAHADLSNDEVLFFSLSCDSIEKTDKSLIGTGDYCVISNERINKFKDLLSTFKFTK